MSLHLFPMFQLKYQRKIHFINILKMMMKILIKKMLRIKMMMLNIKDSRAKTVTFLTM